MQFIIKTARNMEGNLIAALDLGSSLIKVVVAGHVNEFELEVMGVGTTVSSGIKNGSVVNIESTTKAIIDAISDAELMCGREIDSVIVNVTGKTVRADNSRGVVAIPNKERVVTESDVVRVVEAAQAVRIPADQQVLHVLSREFSVDDQIGIKDPIGMTGVRLESEVHIVTAGITSINNIDKCISSAGLRQVDKVLASLASSEAVLTGGEKDLGTAVIDIGAGICDIIVYVEGGIAFSSVVPLGGSHITSDISIGLKTTIEAAEIIKKRYGNSSMDGIDPTETIEIPAMGGRPARSALRQEIVMIIEPRMREILELVDRELNRSGLKGELAGGIILTGGCSLMGGIDILAEDVFGLSVGRARPAGITGLVDKVASPEYSTAIGLIRYATRLIETNSEVTGVSRVPGESWAKKVRRWMEENL